MLTLRQSLNWDKRACRLLQTRWLRLHLFATFFFGPLSSILRIYLSGWKSGPELSHEPPRVDRNEIYYPECPTGDHCPLPCLGRIDETRRRGEGGVLGGAKRRSMQLFWITVQPGDEASVMIQVEKRKVKKMQRKGGMGKATSSSQSEGFKLEIHLKWPQSVCVKGAEMNFCPCLWKVTALLCLVFLPSGALPSRSKPAIDKHARAPSISMILPVVPCIQWYISSKAWTGHHLFRVSNWCKHVCFWRKPTQTHGGLTNSTQKVPGVEPRTFLLWGDNAMHLFTVKNQKETRNMINSLMCLWLKLLTNGQKILVWMIIFRLSNGNLLYLYLMDQAQ